MFNKNIIQRINSFSDPFKSILLVVLKDIRTINTKGSNQKRIRQLNTDNDKGNQYACNKPLSNLEMKIQDTVNAYALAIIKKHQMITEKARDRKTKDKIVRLVRLSKKSRNNWSSQYAYDWLVNLGRSGAKNNNIGSYNNAPIESEKDKDWYDKHASNWLVRVEYGHSWFNQ